MPATSGDWSTEIERDLLSDHCSTSKPPLFFIFCFHSLSPCLSLSIFSFSIFSLHLCVCFFLSPALYYFLPTFYFIYFFVNLPLYFTFSTDHSLFYCQYYLSFGLFLGLCLPFFLGLSIFLSKYFCLIFFNRIPIWTLIGLNKFFVHSLVPRHLQIKDGEYFYR